MVPEGWKRATYGNVCAINRANLPPSTAPEHELTYLDIGSIPELGVIAEPLERYRFAEAPSRARRIVAAGDVVVSTVRPYLQAFARPTDPPPDLIASTGFAVLTPHDAITSEFLYQTVCSRPFVAQLEARMVGSNYPAVNSSDVAEATLLLPPLPEQRKIAAVLSSVDDAIAATRKVIDQTKLVKQGLLQTLMIRGIGHTRFKKTEIGEIPEEWEVVSLVDICIGKGSYGAGARRSDFSPQLPRYLRITDINDDGTLNDSDPASLSEEDADGNTVDVGDVLFARSGATVGKAYRVTGLEGRAAYAGYLIRFRPDPAKLEPSFLDAFTHSPRYWSWVADTQRAMAQPNINAAEYGSMPVPLPPLPEQREIGRIYSELGELQHRNRQTAAALERLKRGLMQDLLTGRVRVQPD